MIFIINQVGKLVDLMKKLEWKGTILVVIILGGIMEDRLVSKQSNFKCRTYWQYRNGEKEKLEEPETKTAQYEMGIDEDEFGEKFWLKIFSRVGTEPEHKRDYYTYLEFPTDSSLMRSLLDFLKGRIK